MLAKIALPLCLLAGAASAAELTYLPPTASDMTRASLPPQPKAAGPLLNEAREPVAVSWSLDAAAPLDFAVRPFEAESRQYYLDVTAADLATGVVLNTTVDRALVRVSPAARSKAGVPGAAAIVLQAGGQEFRADTGIEVFADQAAMKATGVGFGEGTVAFRLAPTVGSGEITLRFEGMAKNAGDRFVVNVFEPESAVALRAASRSDSYAFGSPVVLSVGLEGAAASADAFSGYVSAPDGTEVGRLRFSRGPGGELFAMLPRLEHAGPGVGALYEAHVFVDSGQGPERVLRDVRTAFAAGTPSARLNGSLDALAVDNDGLAFGVGVEAASAGRFEVRGVLFGSLADGTMVPVAAAHSATWLEAGKGSVRVSVSAEALEDSPASAPYEFRHLSLLDQSRMQTLWRQERAVRLVP